MTEQQLLLKLSALCSRTEYCLHDLTEKMRRWEIDEPTQERARQFLLKERYVDESRFARFFARDKLRFNKWGKRKIEMALKSKHLPKELIHEALDEISDDECEQTLRGLLEQKMRTMKADDDYERRGKLIRFALGRGFDYYMIEKVLEDTHDNIHD